jgi:hypothetical protein
MVCIREMVRYTYGKVGYTYGISIRWYIPFQVYNMKNMIYSTKKFHAIRIYHAKYDIFHDIFHAIKVANEVWMD